jgi:hypothetical protein
MAQLKTHAQKSLVDELKSSLTGSSLLFDLSKGDADLESLVKANGGFVGPTSMLKITMTEGGSQAEGVDIDVVSLFGTLYRDVSPFFIASRTPSPVPPSSSPPSTPNDAACRMQSTPRRSPRRCHRGDPWARTRRIPTC